MKTKSIILILIFSLVIFFSFLIFRLNQIEVTLDLLFREIQVKLGLVVLSTFLAGVSTCLILERAAFKYFRSSTRTKNVQ